MGGAISPSDPQVVAAGGDFPLFAITPSAGYRLADVVVDGVSVGAVGAYRFTGVDSSHSIWALFAPDTYDIVPSAGPKARLADTRSQCPRRRHRVHDDPDVGYHIARVVVDGDKVASNASYTFRDVGPHRSM